MTKRDTRRPLEDLDRLIRRDTIILFSGVFAAAVIAVGGVIYINYFAG